jgi:hypothetical protein
MKSQWLMGCIGHSLVHFPDMGDKMHSLSYCYTKTHWVQSWPSTCELFGQRWRKICSCTLGCSKVTQCAQKSHAAVHNPPDMYFQTELFVTANREGGLLSQTRNCEN